MKKIIIILGLVIIVGISYATQMIVHTTSGDETFNLDDITSITFENPSNIVFQENFDEWNETLWQGNRWSYNINQGTWQPNVENGIAYMQIGDYDWAEIRTNQLWSSGKTFSATLTPYLESGGTHEDEIFFGLSENWVHYDTEIAAGIKLDENGNVMAWCEDNWEMEIFGSYTPGEVITLCISWNSDGTLTLTGGGGSYTIDSSLLQINEAYLVIVNKASTDGFDLDQVIITTD